MGATKKRTKPSKQNNSKKQGGRASNKLIVKIYPKTAGDLANLKKGHIVGDYRIETENNIPDSMGGVDYFLGQVGEYIRQQTTPIDLKNIEKSLKLNKQNLFSHVKFVYELVPQLYNTTEEANTAKPTKEKEEVVLDLKKPIQEENQPPVPTAEPPTAEPPTAEPPKAEPPKAEPPKAEPPKAKESKAEPPKPKPEDFSEEVLNAYKTLDLDLDDTPEEIRQAYKKISKQYHPDRQTGKNDTEKKEAADKWEKYNGAIEVLKENNIYKGGKKGSKKGSKKTKGQGSRKSKK